MHRRFTPYLRGVADFWEKDLVCRDGVYHVVGDGMHERTDGNIRDNGVPEDPVNTLGYLKTFFTWMPRISEALDLDEKKEGKMAGNRREPGTLSKGDNSGDSGESNSLERGGCEAGGSASGRNAGQRDLL